MREPAHRCHPPEVPLLAALVTAVLVLSAGPASAHLLGSNSVDGGEIRYIVNTRYVGAVEHAVSAWNALGKVSIVPDDFWHVADLTFVDIDDCSQNFVGRYHGGTHTITFNVCNMENGASDLKWNQAAAHELGHALGLEHSYPGQLVSEDAGSVDGPQDHDRADYHELWG